jgi:RHS repeat-associated protein
MVSKDVYYPFGMRIEGLSQTVDDPDPRYKYNGKELDEEKGLNWLAYGARYYDSEIGRWHVVDPAGEFWSVYLYVANNPLRYTDFNGMFADDFFFNENYELIGHVKTEEPHRAIIQDEAGNTIDELAIHGIDEADLDRIEEFLGLPIPAIDINFDSKVATYVAAGTAPFQSLAGALAFYGNKYLYAATESLPEGHVSDITGRRSHGYLDFTGDLRARYLFYFANDKLYGSFDAGNYLWGSAMRNLGFTLDVARLAAHGNNAWSKVGTWFGGPSQYPSPWYELWDSQTDQNAIRNGYLEN